MEEALQIVIEMSERILDGFKEDLKDVTPEEVNWRPLPQANSINLILRHLRIEAVGHVANIERGARSVEQPAESIPLDFERNLNELEELFSRFLVALRQTTLGDLEQHTALAYANARPGRALPPHFLAYHQALHLAMHWGQIRTIRNLYRKTRGEPARFFPDNPMFPQ
jgi:hypothetical protein